MLRIDLSDEVVTSRIKDFLEKHPEGYDKDTIVALQKSALWGRRTSSTVSELDEIYNYLQLDQKDNNIYQAFADMITSKFDIDRPIYEIGGGHLPTVGKILSLKQKQGTVTIYDPKLLFTNALMIGYKPCDAIIPMMKYIAKNDLDFMIALCDCAHGFPEIMDEDDINLWYQSCEWPVYSKYAEEERYKKSGQEIRRVKRLSMEKYGNYCPVIYNSTETKY